MPNRGRWPFVVIGAPTVLNREPIALTKFATRGARSRVPRLFVRVYWRGPRAPTSRGARIIIVGA